MTEECSWILPLIVSGACFGFADTLCDIVIHQDEDHGKKGIEIHIRKHRFF